MPACQNKGGGRLFRTRTLYHRRSSYELQQLLCFQWSHFCGRQENTHSVNLLSTCGMLSLTLWRSELLSKSNSRSGWIRRSCVSSIFGARLGKELRRLERQCRPQCGLQLKQSWNMKMSLSKSEFTIEETRIKLYHSLIGSWRAALCTCKMQRQAATNNSAATIFLLSRFDSYS